MWMPMPVPQKTSARSNFPSAIIAPTRSPTRWNIFSGSSTLGSVTPTSVIFQPFSRRCAHTASFSGYPAKSAPTSKYFSLIVFIKTLLSCFR